MSSCLPLILLASVPLTLQSEVPYPKSTDILRERRPASGKFNRTSIIDTQSAKESKSVPAYRKIDKYENRMSSISHDYVYSGGSGSDIAVSQARRVASVPVPLKFNFRSSPGHDAPSSETEKGRGKKRASDPGPYEGSECMSEDLFDDDHVAPFRSSHSSKVTPSAVAGPSGSTYNPRHASQDLSLTPLSQLYMPEEGSEAWSPHSSIVSSVASSPNVHPAEAKEGAHTPECVEPSLPSPRSPKRVSFSSTADKGVSAAYSTSQEDSFTSSRVPWGGLALFGKPYLVARPPPSQRISLPAVRGQAAGRSILKRTTSYSDDSTLPNSHELHSTGVPIHDKIQIDSLRRSSKRTSKRDSAVSVLNDAINSDAFHEIDLSQETPGNAPSASKDATVTTATLSSERAVRHWSMVGSNWIKRSGLFTQAVNVQ